MLRAELNDCVSAYFRRCGVTDGMKTHVVAFSENTKEDPRQAFRAAYPKLQLSAQQTNELEEELVAIVQHHAAQQSLGCSAAVSSSTELPSDDGIDHAAKRSAWWARVNQIVSEVLDKNKIPASRRRELILKDNTRASLSVVRETYGDMVAFTNMDIENLKRRLSKEDYAYHWKPSGVARAFTATYVGDAPVRLYRFVIQCWSRYCKSSPSYYPFCALVQSAGFGKSRLLRQLAIKTAAVNRHGGMRMHVLYLCVREDTTSRGGYGYAAYPPESVWLPMQFFPKSDRSDTTSWRVQKLVTHLLATFGYVMETKRWEDVHASLMKLFTGQDTDIRDAISRHKSQRTTEKLPGKPHVLVLALDEAGSLLPKPEADDAVGWLHILRLALIDANRTIRTMWGPQSGIFAIAADSNPKIIGSTPKPKIPRVDPSARPVDVYHHFEPFVLTQTWDVFSDHYPQSSKLDVLDALRREQRSAHHDPLKKLVLLGRPLWKNIIGRDDRVHDRVDVTTIAAESLLRQMTPYEASSLNKATMFGVASTLCRLGLRAHSSSPLAALTVSEFMAVLSYVGEDDGHGRQIVSSYASDPILSLGAAYIWHEIKPAPLAYMILPQLRKLFSEEMLAHSPHEMDSVVARMVLLLAMDACGVLKTGYSCSRWMHAGELCSLWTFLSVLHGDTPTLQIGSNLDVATEAVTDAALTAMKTQWHGWVVSFTHFVELEEPPSEECLWAMFARRAAGVCVRGDGTGVDLVIPICTLSTETTEKDATADDAHVSILIVRVMDEKTAEATTRSALVSTDDTVLRVVMSLRDTHVDRCYVQEDNGDSRSCVLWLRGLEGWSCRRDERGESEMTPAVEIVSEAVAAELRAMLGSTKRENPATRLLWPDRLGVAAARKSDDETSGRLLKTPRLS